MIVRPFLCNQGGMRHSRWTTSTAALLCLLAVSAFAGGDVPALCTNTSVHFETASLEVISITRDGQAIPGPSDAGTLTLRSTSVYDRSDPKAHAYPPQPGARVQLIRPDGGVRAIDVAVHR